ncbi:hypothetical protein KIW84_024993 [Lathyrus oleraceus]|uniref:Uncharacterized protein n=1 Tax=Pisum sativum TaxID=3888 RepID=A0A9D4YLL2_PEA|nr:hypothetical protein KIW84_024993 [Pisum sativum]
MEPRVESHDDQHVETNVETSIPTSGEPHAEHLTEPIVDVLVFDSYLNNILDGDGDYSEDLRGGKPHNEELEVQVERNLEAHEVDEIPIANIMKRIIESVTKTQEKAVENEVVDFDEEIDTDEVPNVKVMKSIPRFMVEGVKEKKKVVPPKTYMKNTETVKKKTPQGTPVSKKRKVEEKTTEKNSQKRMMVWPLTLDKKLFMGIHVPNIMVKYQGQSASENSSTISKATIKYVLLELIEASKYLQETIISSTIRKKNVDGLIIMFYKKKEAYEEEAFYEEEEETTSDSEEEEQFASEEETSED